MIKNIKYILKNFISLSQKKTICFLLLSPLSAVIQSFGILSIFPFISVLIKPEVIVQNKFFIQFYPLNYNDNFELAFQFGLIFLIVNIISTIVIIGNTILSETLSTDVINKFRIKFYEKILKPSSYLNIAKNRSDFLNIVFTELENIKTSSSALLFLIQSIFLMIGYMIILLLFNVKLFLLILSIIILFFLLFLFNKKILKKIHIIQVSISKKISQVSIYIQLGIKDLLILNLGKKFLNNLKLYQNEYLKFEMVKLFVSLYPRHILEIIIYLTALSYVYLNYENLLLSQQLNYFALIILLIWRAIPVFFNLYRHLITINTYKTSFKNFFKYEGLLKKNISTKVKINSFKNEILIKNLKFNYSEELNFKFNCKIKKGNKIHLIGSSGSGKSTFLNLLTGLLTYKSGEIFIDNHKLGTNYKTSIFGYVTQDVFLFQGTLAENIIMTKHGKKDLKMLKKIFHICELENIVSNFDKIFKTKIEINSPELSGGQKQRIAIARVLYLGPKILILDEATNALDKVSELSLLNNIFKSFPNLTIILVNHRNLKIKFDKKLKLINNKNEKCIEINAK